MKKLLLFTGIYLTIVLSFVAMPIAASPAFASATSDICNGIGASGGGTNCSGSGPTLGTIIRAVIEILSVIVGVVSVVMIIVGGFQYVVSNGDSGKIAGAKNTIIYSIVGLIVVAFSQALVYLVLNRIIGVK